MDTNDATKTSDGFPADVPVRGFLLKEFPLPPGRDEDEEVSASEVVNAGRAAPAAAMPHPAGDINVILANDLLIRPARIFMRRNSSRDIKVVSASQAMKAQMPDEQFYVIKLAAIHPTLSVIKRFGERCFVGTPLQSTNPSWTVADPKTFA